MALYTQTIREGLKFSNEKEAIEYFKTTLLDKTPLGKLYEEIHNTDFGNYEVEATGLNEKEINVNLDNPNHAAKLYRRVNLNTYGNTEEINSKYVIELLGKLIKTVEISSIIVVEEINNVSNLIQDNNEKVLTDLITDFNKMSTSITAEASTLGSHTIAISLVDEVKNKAYNTVVALDKDGRVEQEDISRAVQSIFLKSIEGKFDGETLTAGNRSLTHLLDYAHENEKQIKIEIIDN